MTDTSNPDTPGILRLRHLVPTMQSLVQFNNYMEEVRLRAQVAQMAQTVSNVAEKAGINARVRELAAAPT